ncbi:glutamate--cysteine ligase [Pseudaeromonas paramecii]|uniref:Glutamate--cysteine ligase n=1 Tax=Pseudaeromonas paramecii TaxID=2138166 RepID=A0ABP8QH76_9GAMM
MATCLSLTDMLSGFSSADRLSSLRGIRRGLEREALRITPEGRLSMQDHPAGLGAALTHSHITTDYAESMMEFITPASDSMESLLNQLGDIHRHALRHLGQERLWPLSMPCFIGDQTPIRLAQYGHSNEGRVKTLYRQGLHHRYGSLMQVISGVHYNFSMPDSFWSEWQEIQAAKCQCKRFISDGYMGLIRNVYRFGWLVPYLFGASPALCSSFLNGRPTSLPFQSLGKGTLYLPYATSLRLSDLGYTNKAQSVLSINHDNLASYVGSVRRALHTSAPEFAAIGVKEGDEYRQLNDKVLQLENELYAPIRPKRSLRNGERTLCALERRGIEYIELRTLDVNPFSPLGVEAEQLRFLDLFLVWCLLRPSPALDEAEMARNRRNLNKVVLEGRRPGLQLESERGELSLRDWGEQLFDELALVAELLDKAYGRIQYQLTLQQHRAWLRDPSLTLSARLLDTLLAGELDNGVLGRQLAERYGQQLLEEPLRFWDEEYFAEEATASLAKQADIEAADHLSFDDFLSHYLAR